MDWAQNNVDIIGLIAAILGTFALVPQVIKTFKSHSVCSLSLTMYITIAINSLLWLVYSIVLSLNPLIIQSVIVFLCATIVVVMKLLWK